MTPEERKVLALNQEWKPSVQFATHLMHYPHCCAYHEGFDAALRLLNEFTVYDATHTTRKFYGIEATPSRERSDNQTHN